MNTTNETIAQGAEKYIRTFELIEKMAQTDGSKESALKLIHEEYPEWTWDNLNVLLIALNYGKLIESITIEGKQVMEPIMPKLTEKAKSEIEARKAVFAST